MPARRGKPGIGTMDLKSRYGKENNERGLCPVPKALKSFINVYFLHSLSIIELFHRFIFIITDDLLFKPVLQNA
jgi:hypothetical protein